MLEPNTLPVLETFPETSGNVIAFPETFPETFPDPPEVSDQVSFSRGDLADLACVSPPALGKYWIPYLEKVAANQLRQGRRYTAKAAELIVSLREARRAGVSADDWVIMQVGSPAQVVATAAASAGVIVPVEVVEAGAAGNSSLALAQHQRAIAASLLEAVASAVHGQRHALAAQSGDIDVERIAASEALLIAREEQVRATVRAEFARQRQAQEEAAMAQQLAQFQQPGVRPQ